VIESLEDAPPEAREHYAKLPSGRWELQLTPSDQLVRLLYSHRIFARRIETAAKPFPQSTAMVNAAKLEALATRKGIR
jgi:hypothetical protein